MQEHSSTTSPTLEALEVLRGGREILMGGCWVGHSPLGNPKVHCAVTAVDKKALSWQQCSGVVEALNEAAWNLYPDRQSTDPSIIHLNDHPDTTLNDVLTCFDEAERILKDRLAGESQ